MILIYVYLFPFRNSSSFRSGNKHQLFSVASQQYQIWDFGGGGLSEVNFIN